MKDRKRKTRKSHSECLKCSDCGKKDATVKWRFNVLAYARGGDGSPIRLCEECAYERYQES